VPRIARPGALAAVARPSFWAPPAGMAAGGAPREWFRISNRSTSDADIYIYGEIGYWGVSAESFIEQLRAVNAATIALHINSEGGDAFDGLAIYNALLRHPAYVTSYVDGLAASAASYIAQAGDEVIMAESAMMMIHRAAGVVAGNRDDVAELLTILDALDGNLANLYAQTAGGEVAGWAELMRGPNGQGTWYTAAQAVEAGLADRLEPISAGNDHADTIETLRERVSMSSYASHRPPATQRGGVPDDAERPAPDDGQGVPNADTLAAEGVADDAPPPVAPEDTAWWGRSLSDFYSASTADSQWHILTEGLWK
jgi:ATP-dependent protease ClpP protease subunit